MSTNKKIKISAISKSKEKYKYKVSIIVPCYNTKPWLDECLQSLVDQTLQDIEIICVNDGSSDGTGNRLDEWQTQYLDKIKVIHQKNGGSSAARNASMAIAQGECIGFVDSDDFVDACMYDKLYKILTDNNADVIKCRYSSFNDNHPIKLNTNAMSCTILVDPIQQLIEGNNLLWNCLFKKKFLQKNKIIFNADIKTHEDIIFTYQVTTNLPKMYSISDILYYHRENRTGQLTSLNNKKLYDLFKIFTFIETNIITSSYKAEVEKCVVRHKVLCLTDGLKRIQFKYKKDFLFKIAVSIFNKKSAIDIYKKILLHKYRKPINYLFAPLVLILFHCCYLWQNISIKNILRY